MPYTNQLINSKSPYLLQHAHNPVNWNMWSEEILEKAKQENKPILVSIGYSSCHWCHVMERESFENENTAALMNEHFVNIKIDREERPDLDHIYMDAVQAMTGSGGWPLNVFLTPDLKPFYGGTYFPPNPAYGRMSWTQVLESVSKAFKERSEEIEQQAEKLTEHIRNSNSFIHKININNDELLKDSLDEITKNILKNADEVWGGFGNAPKFPQTFSIQFLLRQYHSTKDEKYLQQATLSLDKMIMGGLYDQIGGGFARYSTDEKWFAPHFEKMLYDNALLVSVLSEAYQITQKEIYKETIEQTLAFIEREMMSEDSGFYSALDADTEDVEGKFYTWNKKEIEHLLQLDTELFCEIFNVYDDGNWEHTNILWLKKTVEEFAKDNNIEFEVLKAKIKFWKKTLLLERNNRAKPLLDDKILCSWNALMNIAYCKAYSALGNEHYRTIAIKNADFVFSKMFVSKTLKHCFKEIAYNEAFLDDYAYWIQSCIELHKISGNINWLVKSNELLDFVVKNFSDDQNIFFKYNHCKTKNLIANKVEVYDGATPSANAVLCQSLISLSYIFDNDNLKARANTMIKYIFKAIKNYPTSFAVWACNLQTILSQQKYVVVIGELLQDVHYNIISIYQPNSVFVFDNKKSLHTVPQTINKKNNSKPTFYLCLGENCLAPETDIIKFLHFYNI